MRHNVIIWKAPPTAEINEKENNSEHWQKPRSWSTEKSSKLGRHLIKIIRKKKKAKINNVRNNVVTIYTAEIHKTTRENYEQYKHNWKTQMKWIIFRKKYKVPKLNWREYNLTILTTVNGCLGIQLPGDSPHP